MIAGKQPAICKALKKHAVFLGTTSGHNTTCPNSLHTNARLSDIFDDANGNLGSHGASERGCDFCWEKRMFFFRKCWENVADSLKFGIC